MIVTFGPLSHISSSTMTRPSQRGLYECACGSVQADVLVPPSVIKPMSILCSCRDCVRFTEGVMKASNNNKSSTHVQEMGLVTGGSGAVHFAMLRNCQISPTKGQDHVRTCKLTAETGTTRVYASCCGTPLGLGGRGFTIIHPQLLKPHPTKTKDQVDLNAESLKPTHCVHCSSAPKDAAPIPNGVKASDGPPPGLILQFLVFAMSGIFSKKTKGLLGGPNVEPSIGLESVVVE